MNEEAEKILKEHYKKIGKKGGSSTLKKYGSLKYAEWGKLGGRPKKAKVSKKILIKAT